MGPDIENALQAISSMLDRSRKAREKFAPGTAQHSLQTNRIKALCIASALIKKEFAGDSTADDYTKEALEKALAPIASLISKSEKSQQRLTKGTWQHAMLEKNLKALYIALPLLRQEIDLP